MTKTVILPEMNIGLIGHVDHGKTTLTKALSGKWTDTHSEELKRGITIKLGYADIDIKKNGKIVRRVSLVDSPGHETLMAIMISGAAIMDGAMLLIAANELCPQPQTREHLAALKVIGIKNIVVIQNKIDLVTKQEAEKNYKQIRDFVNKELGFTVPIIPISAQKKVNVDLVLEAIQELFPTPKRDKKEIPEFIIARSFDINKPGTELDKLTGGVIGGAIIAGKFKVGQEIEIKPGFKVETKGQIEWKSFKTKVEKIVVGSTSVKEKTSGGSIAIATTLDPSVVKSDSLVGNVAGCPGKLPPVWHNLNLEVHLFKKIVGTKEETLVEPIKGNEPLMINIATATTLGIVKSPGKKTKVNLKRPICANKGGKVALSRQIKNRWHLIGYGVIQ